MSKCKDCGKGKGTYPHYDGGMVCDNCAGSYFTCPECGRVFNQDDYEHGDAGTGFCRECSIKKEEI